MNVLTLFFRFILLVTGNVKFPCVVHSYSSSSHWCSLIVCNENLFDRVVILEHCIQLGFVFCFFCNCTMLFVSR